MQSTIYRTVVPVIALGGIALGLATGSAMGQTSQPLRFETRTSRSADTNTARRSESAVSRDLVEIYQATKQAHGVLAVTTIIDQCRAVLSAADRSAADRTYAEQLLAWGLNRRGELTSDRAAELVEAGRLGEAQELDRRALEDFSEAVERNPTNWRSHHNLAIALALQERFDAAIEEITAAIDLNPDYANAYFNRAELHFERGDYEAAADDYSRAIAMRPDDAQSYNGRAHCRFLLERYEAALADYRRAAELAAGDVAMLTDLADAHQYLGHWEEAAKAYRTAIGTKTDHARAYQNAAWLMATCPDERIRRPDLAVAAAQKAIELSGAPTAEQLDTLAAAHAASGNNRQAIATARQALRLADDESLAGEIRARIELYNSGQAYIQPASEQAVAVAEPPRQQSSHVARTPSELRRK